MTLVGPANHVPVCLKGTENEPVVQKLCEKLLDVAQLSYSSRPRMGELVKVLAQLHPRILLEVALENDETAQLIGEKVLGRTDDQREIGGGSSFSKNVGVIIDWVAEDPSQRVVRAAKFVQYIEEDEQGNVSWSPIAEELINLPDAGIDVLNVILSRFGYGVASGPWSYRYVRRRPLIENLKSHDNPSICAWAEETLRKLDKQIVRSTEEEHSRDERFE